MACTRLVVIEMVRSARILDNLEVRANVISEGPDMGQKTIPRVLAQATGFVFSCDREDCK